MVNVRVDTEEALEDVLDDALELCREGHSNLGGEDGLIIQLVLHPRHEIINVLWRRDLHRLLEVHSIRPVVLISDTHTTNKNERFSSNGKKREKREHVSYFGPADMTGHSVGVQNSVMVPYNMLIWLKKSTATKKKEKRKKEDKKNTN